MSSTYYFQEIMALDAEEALAELEVVFASQTERIPPHEWLTLASVSGPMVSADARWHRVAIRAYERSTHNPASTMAWEAARHRVSYIRKAGADPTDPLRDPEAVFDWVRDLAGGRDPHASKAAYLSAQRGMPERPLTAEERAANDFGTPLLQALKLIMDLNDYGIPTPRDLEPWLTPLETESAR